MSSNKTSIIPLSVGTRVRYEYPLESGMRVIEGVKAAAVGEDSPESVALMAILGNRNFTIVLDSGESVVVSRYARVEVL